jgi:glycosyltransferase involved in cell wall biosynthesis
LEEVVTAARAVGLTVLNFESAKDFGDGVEYTGVIKNDDAKLARYYSQCKYVSGLRRVEGFELPVIEGLMCGSRPICFDLPAYRQWFEGLVEFIPEAGGRAQIIPALIGIFKKEPRRVSSAEKQLVKEKFNWGTIARGFWDRVYA